MKRLPENVRRLLRLRRNVDAQVADDVDAEIRFHLESRVDELISGGLDRAAAERRAREEFGDVRAAGSALRRESARTARRVRRNEWLNEIRQDLRYGWRKLRAQPGFAAVAILSMALGVGANTAIFSVVRAVLLRPLPYEAADRLVQVWEMSPEGRDHNLVSSGNYMDWGERASSFEALGAYSSTYGLGLIGEDGEARHVVATSMTPSVLRMLGVEALHGRTFTVEEGRPGGAPVAILSHGLWWREFGGDPEVVGRTLSMNETPYTIVGVMPPDFDFPNPNVELWTPLTFGEEDRPVRRSHQWRVLGRLAKAETPQQAQVEMEAIAARLAEELPQYMEGWGINLLPFRADLVAGVRPLLLVLWSMVVVVLFVACANLANLFLARAMAREREVAVRRAIGAGRWRLVRQFLTESFLVAVLGSALGVVVVAVGLDALVALAPADIPLLNHTRIDGIVLVFAAAVTVLATLVFGLVPALRATVTDPASSLRATQEHAGGARQARLRAALLVAEMALSVVLLVGAGLLVRSFWRLQAVDLGFDKERLLAVMIDVPLSAYPETPDQVQFYERLMERVEGLPGVVSATGTAEPPVIGYNNTFSFAIENRPSGDADGREDPVPLRAVTPGFFRTMGISLLRGRVFDERDRTGAPRAIVINESLARRHWSDESPLGKRISFEGPDGERWWEIVGVVRDTRHFGADRPPVPALYMAQAQKSFNWMSWLTILVRTEVDPLTVAPAFREALRSLDNRLPIERLVTMDEVYAESSARQRFAASLLGGFAALALLLGVVGIYGVLSYSVARRTREIGLRMALGAQRRTVAVAFLREGLTLALTGVVIGLTAALLLSRFLESLVFGITTTDAMTFAGVPVLLTALAALAAYLPARRATRIDPVRALRVE